MKKLTTLILLAIALVSLVNAQDAFEVQSRVYKAALKNYDVQAATIALYNMQALKPERTDLNDSLAYLYFSGERYAQAYIIGEEILKTNPKNSGILEVVAVSKQNLGLIKESLADYEKLYAAEKSVYYLYQTATLQYQLKRYGECIASLDQILASADADKQQVTIRLQQGSQEVPMKAAAYNVKGICALELNQEEAAKQNFTKAIELFPDFALAKGNLDMVNKKKVTPASPAATTTKTPVTAPKK